MKDQKIRFVKNAGGPVLGYWEDSGVQILEKDGFYFKNLSKDGLLHPYEDWRLPVEERAQDLAGRMSIAQIAGLMLYGLHQTVPGAGNSFSPSLYGGRPFEESGAGMDDLSDNQKALICQENVRHLLLAQVSSAKDAANWNNNLQALAESQPFGIPIVIGSDPRHGNDNTKEFNAGAGGDISVWPEQLGMAAAFDPELVRQFGEIASREYRALGITSALSPQIDPGTEPRWFRFSGTFGESPRLSTDLARAYIDGFQTSSGECEVKDGWGTESVAAMMKHWPGGGAGEGGRDAHFGFGKYSVYPGNNLEEHIRPFVEGGLNLEGGTGQAAAVMPYYTVPYEQDPVYGENVGCSYSKYLITDLLREKYGYEGVVCTDWGITTDQQAIETVMTGKCWGVEGLSTVERCLKIILAGVDQFGGLEQSVAVMEAYDLGVELYGEDRMRKRLEQSAVRILKNIFRTGLFENPYVDADHAQEIVGNPAFMEAGFAAQKKSVVLLKNKSHVLPLKEGAKVYIPEMYSSSYMDWFGNVHEGCWSFPLKKELASGYLQLVDDPDKADCAIVFMHCPGGLARADCGYSVADREQGGNGYVPISLQYRPYTAEYARKTSIAGGDPREDFCDRSYHGKTVTVNNEADLDVLLKTRQEMREKPVIAVVSALGPMVVSEFESSADAILLTICDLHQAVLEIITGKEEPSGLLPFQIPVNMRTVEEQKEDVPFDMVCHVDSEGHTYDFAYGMNWRGVIFDKRVKKYRRQKDGIAMQEADT